MECETNTYSKQYEVGVLLSCHAFSIEMRLLIRWLVGKSNGHYYCMRASTTTKFNLPVTRNFVELVTIYNLYYYESTFFFFFRCFIFYCKTSFVIVLSFLLVLCVFEFGKAYVNG